MRRHLALVFTVGALLSACAEPRATASYATPSYAPTQVKQRACDDGGSGGVVIDGVCL